MADKMKTVVVLVQENRSFDHMLGWMKSLNPEIDSVTGAEVNYTVAGDASSTPVHFGNASQPCRYRELVREFAVCDRWFASVPTSTQPNPMFVHSATSHGLVGNDRKMLLAGMPQRTIFDALQPPRRRPLLRHLLPVPARRPPLQ
ncbi:Non-specific phospholipase C4, partial [Zea mays]